MKTRKYLGLFAGLLLAASAAAVILRDLVAGEAVINLKSGETAFASVYVMREVSGKFDADVYYLKQPSQYDMGFELTALKVDDFVVKPGLAYIDGVALVRAGKVPPFKTRFSLTILNNTMTRASTDFVDLAMIDDSGKETHWFGTVVKGDFMLESINF